MWSSGCAKTLKKSGFFPTSNYLSCGAILDLTEKSCHPPQLQQTRRAPNFHPPPLSRGREAATTQIFTVREKEKPEELSGVKG